MLQTLADLPLRRRAWTCLATSAIALVVIALYFQYGMGLEPCVKCIYQRFAVVMIAVAALPAMFAAKQLWARLVSFGGWLVSAGWGFWIAHSHATLQQSANSFFATCDTFPRFPDWMPLHEWFPRMFSATGLCGDIDWQFLGMSMPEWMRVIFAAYFVVALVLLVLHFYLGGSSGGKAQRH